MPDYILLDDVIDEMIDNISYIKLNSYIKPKEWWLIYHSFYFIIILVVQVKKIFLILFTFFLLTGCDNQKDNKRFKEEYEKLNGSLIDVTIPLDNYIKYIEKDDVLNIINKGTGLIFICNETSNECREMVNTLISAVDSTDLNRINYYKGDDLSFLSSYVDNANIPLVLFVYEGNIKSYKQGTGEERELLDIYLDGIHDVLNDICDDECDDW